MARQVSEKAREARVRRALAELGYTLHEARTRPWTGTYHKTGYMITNCNNAVVAGPLYDCALEDVEWFAFKHLPMNAPRY